jgi:peptide subunit release factor 1 (eRF1)
MQRAADKISDQLLPHREPHGSLIEIQRFNREAQDLVEGDFFNDEVMDDFQYLIDFTPTVHAGPLRGCLAD